MQYEKVNMELPPGEVLEFSPPNRTSPFGFIPRLHQSFPEMETLMAALAFHATPN